MIKALDGFSHLVLVGARTAVAFFGYQGMPSFPLRNDLKVRTLADTDQDAVEALRALADATDSAAADLTSGERPGVQAPEGPLTAASAAAAPPHTELTNTGGRDRHGHAGGPGRRDRLPGPRCDQFPGRRQRRLHRPDAVDPGRESLDVTAVICANSRYRILEAEFQRAGIPEPGTAAASMTSLAEPAVDWTALARGFGVPSSRATTGEELLDGLRKAHTEPCPHLIQAVL